jgi:WD40 repeat protein
VNRIAVSDDNQTLITASADKTVRLWDLTTQTSQAILEGHQSYVNTLRVDGPYLWSADADKVILVWDLQQRAPLRQINGFSTDIWRFTVLPNGHLVTIGGNQPVVRVWQGVEPIEP